MYNKGVGLMMSHTVEYYHEHKAMGLCVLCSQPVVPGLVVCQYHRTRQSIQRKRKTDKRRKLRRCISCGLPLHPEMDKNRSKCVGCRQHNPQLAKLTSERKPHYENLELGSSKEL